MSVGCYGELRRTLAQVWIAENSWASSGVCDDDDGLSISRVFGK